MHYLLRSISIPSWFMGVITTVVYPEVTAGRIGKKDILIAVDKHAKNNTRLLIPTQCGVIIFRPFDFLSFYCFLLILL